MENRKRGKIRPFVIMKAFMCLEQTREKLKRCQGCHTNAPLRASHSEISGIKKARGGSRLTKCQFVNWFSEKEMKTLNDSFDNDLMNNAIKLSQL